MELDIAQCPDLAPALAVRAALRPGQTARLVNAGRLRLKECDRLAAIPEELNKLGGQLTEGADFLEIRGVERLMGTRVVARDLRGGAALIIAALSAEGETEILDSGHIERGYEDFDTRLQELGAEIERTA